MPHVRHEGAAGGVELADRQLLGHFSDIRGGRLVDLEAHEPSGLSNEVGLGADKPGAARLLLLVKAEHEQADVVRRRGRGLGGGRLLVEALVTRRLTLVLVVEPLALIVVMTGLLKSRRGP